MASNAAGDAASRRRPGTDRPVRAEHFDNATKQGVVVAKNILGRAAVQDEPQWFWSDQFGLNLQQCGDTGGADRIVVRGSLAERDFIAFYLTAGVLTGAFAVERGGDIFTVKELLARGATPDPRLLADASVELDELAELAEPDEPAEPAEPPASAASAGPLAAKSVPAGGN